MQCSCAVDTHNNGGDNDCDDGNVDTDSGSSGINDDDGGNDPMPVHLLELWNELFSFFSYWIGN